ncbi:MAG TPA: HDIG domain-containing protein [Polyangiaceae bacterium]|nr:HDIG domain-containing protein [Polyangiaceae bacterium]
MTTPSQAPLSAPDRERAIHALERAVACAERGVADRPVVLIDSADIAGLSPLDVRALLDRVMMGEYADEGLDSLLATGVLDAVLPEIKALVGFGDGEWRHKDVWKHTKQVVTQAVPRIEVRYGALFHDIGKVKTRSISPDGEVHFFGHAEVGARMFDKLERRGKLFGHEQSLRDEVRFLVLHHLRASQYDGKWTDSAVRRFAREIGPSLDNLLCLSRADITTKRPEKKRRGINMIDGLAERIAELAALDAKQPPLPTGLGTDLMAAFGIPPSKKLGDIKRALELAVEAGEIEERLESAAYVQFIAERKARFGLE